LVHITFLKNIAAALAVLSLINALIGLLSIQFFPFGFFAHKPIMSVVSDLAFVEGAAIFFVGALLAFVSSHLSRRISTLIMVGAAMIGISIIFGIFR